MIDVTDEILLQKFKIGKKIKGQAEKFMKSIIVGLIVVVCVIGSAGGTYLFVDQTKQNEIKNLTSQIDNLNDINEDKQEFDRLIIKALRTEGIGWLNNGWARAYKDEAALFYKGGDYDWGGLYYNFAYDYYDYVADNFKDAKSLFNQALKYATNDKTLEITQKYIELMNITTDFANVEADICDDFRLACYYFNMSDFENGNNKVIDANNHIEQRNAMLDTYDNAFEEIDALLESSWTE